MPLQEIKGVLVHAVYLGPYCPAQPFKKECDCPYSLHTAAHWLYEDGRDRAKNLEYLERTDVLAFQAFAADEYVRLRDKRTTMQWKHIEYIPEQYTRPDLDERQRELVARWQERLEGRVGFCQVAGVIVFDR